MKVLALLLLAIFIASTTAQVDLHDMPEFPRLAELDASSTVVASTMGPDNNILNGKPLKVPIIVDPFAQTPGTDAAEQLDRITQVLTMEPPSAAEPETPAADEVDILEVLNHAEKKKNKSLAKKVKKMNKNKSASDAKLAEKAAKAGLTEEQIQSMSAVKSEMKILNQLIKKATKIQSELPKKKARLELLQTKLREAAKKTAKKLAGKKADEQKKVSKDVEGKIEILKQKLEKLENAKGLLKKSIDGLKKVASGKAEDISLIQEVENAIEV